MKHKPDYILLAAVITLILLGVVILTSVSAALSQEKFGFATFYLFRHIIFGLLIGLLLAFGAFKISLSRLKKWSPALLLMNLFLLVLVFVPQIGITAGGASRWINLGFTSFQPSEFLKLTFILYLAFWLSSLLSKPSTTLIAFVVIIGLISNLLILQPDFSTLGIVLICALAMYFLAGTSFKHNFLIVSAGIIALAALIKFAPYRFERLLVFLKPEIDPMGIGYQIKQALIAIGSGGISGRGLSMGGFLPQPMADSIFACFAEQWGFIGSLLLIVLFLVFAWRGFDISKKTQDKFYQLTAVGITCWISLQAFVNIGSMVGILPLTGIPLPFISYGGSALVAELVGVGILLNISKRT